MNRQDCIVVYQCYRLYQPVWHLLNEDNAVTNIWCEHMCYAADARYQYSGTISNKCYCRKKQPTWINDKSKYACTDHFQCPGDTSTFCGGSYESIRQLTVSKIELSTETEKTTQASCAMSVSRRESTMADFMTIITSDTSPAIVSRNTLNTMQKLSRTTSVNSNTAISTVMTDNSKQATTGKRPKKLLCRCPNTFCNTKWHFLDGLDITNSEKMKIILADFYQNILSKITIDKKSVTKEVRKRNSAINKTNSAKFIGTGCIVFLILPIVIIIAIDLLNGCFHFGKRSRRREHVKRNRINAISGDRDIPLQENVLSTEDYYASTSGNNFHPDETKCENVKIITEDGKIPVRKNRMNLV
ncbi:Hypothetical predicted protein [Mytilus galloprovincialis]|uniref:WSC domain-containing protein n=1 Tax=Mytilus galloprovincialis TaxID=29158 RepID=A0A8B6C9P9_MYTGA|nr:Hypothetical predicted protein [Mytilus galloprovincialis]